MSDEPTETEEGRHRVTQQWLRDAHSHLQMAEHALTIADDGPLVGFHAQQCAEKALKGLLVAYGQKVPETHDLTGIAGTLSALRKLPEGLATLALEELTVYAVARDSGDDVRPAGRGKVESALDVARIIRRRVINTLKNQGLTLS